MRERVRAHRHLHPPDDEALDLVHVEALVDPGHQQRLGAVGLGAYFSILARLHLVGRYQQGEHAQRGLREGLGAARAPAAHAHVGLDLEVLPAGGGHPRSPKRD